MGHFAHVVHGPNPDDQDPADTQDSAIAKEGPPSARERQEMTIAFGQAVQAARRRRHMSQDEFATATGLHRTHVSLIERGLREPRLDTLVKLSRSLKVSPADMINWYTHTDSQGKPS
jgi:DNA-binding XRE family transcriptional regulator